MGLLEDALRAYAKYEDRTTDPDTPPSGQALLYVKNGVVHSIDDAGAVTEYGSGGGGGGGDFTLITSETLGADAANIELTGIPGTYRSLMLIATLRSNRSGSVDDGVFVSVGPLAGADTGNNYRFRWIASGTDSASGTGRTGFSLPTGAPGASAAAVQRGSLKVVIDRYATTGQERVAQMEASGSGRYALGIGTWENTTDPIQVMQLRPESGTQFLTGSTAALYGLGT